MEYMLVRSRRKSVAIKILPDGRVLVKSPKKCSIKIIDAFLKEKADWIEKCKNKLKENSEIFADFYSLKKLMVFGIGYDIIDDGKNYHVGEYIIKHTKSSNLKSVLKKFLHSLINEYINVRCYEISKTYGFTYKSITIISANKKWGSCDSYKNLRFNYKLSMLPKRLIDYVICHELCHTKKLNHSKEFWDLLEDMGYNRVEIKKEFAKYNFVLGVFK